MKAILINKEAAIEVFQLFKEAPLGSVFEVTWQSLQLKSEVPYPYKIHFKGDWLFSQEEFDRAFRWIDETDLY